MNSFYAIRDSFKSICRNRLSIQPEMTNFVIFSVTKTVHYFTPFSHYDGILGAALSNRQFFRSLTKHQFLYVNDLLNSLKHTDSFRGVISDKMIE
ncbi:MAG TPA: hypothetical protein DEA22_09580 [Blastocatellia bacterium]|nr:hypothetical protein [Blastocatellia bacterium]